VVETVGLWSDADLEGAFSTGGKAWPSIALPRETFVSYLVAHVLSPAEVDDDRLRDLFLACACAHDSPGALQCFRAHYFSVVTLAVKSFDDSPAFAEEIYQRLSNALFVDDGARRAKIVRYNGRGTLAGFVGTAARRIALRMTASSKRFQGEAELIEQFSQFNEQETTLMKVRYRETFNRALAIALRQLEKHERLVLRMNLVERVSTTKIAALYKVSQPTVSRWIQRAARNIFAMVKDLVCEELDIDTRELESLLLLVRSQIEVPISLAGSVAPAVRGPLTSELENGESLVLEVHGGPPYRLLFLKDGRQTCEVRIHDRLELEENGTIAAIAANTTASREQVREAIARLAGFIAE
jgi:RNA polymerase sigma-70 factor (ECF subfamily)